MKGAYNSINVNRFKMNIVNEQLRAAARAGDATKLKALLLDPNCDTRSKDANGLTALMYAAYCGHTTCLSLLLPVSDPLARDEDYWTALMFAADSGFSSCVEALLPVSDVLAKDDDNWTALMLAACSGDLTCVQLLLPVSDIHAKNNKKQTASEMASEMGYAHLAMLVDAYAAAQIEKLALDSTISHGAQQKIRSLRV